MRFVAAQTKHDYGHASISRNRRTCHWHWIARGVGVGLAAGRMEREAWLLLSSPDAQQVALPVIICQIHTARDCDAATNEQQAEQTDGKRGAQTEGERDRQWEWERAAYDRLRGEREVSVTVTLSLSLSVCPFLSFLAINHLLTDIGQINWYCLWLGGTISADFRWGTEAIIIMLWQINAISFATKWDK